MSRDFLPSAETGQNERRAGQLSSVLRAALSGAEGVFRFACQVLRF